jgi:hypothetical protein
MKPSLRQSQVPWLVMSAVTAVGLMGYAVLSQPSPAQAAARPDEAPGKPAGVEVRLTLVPGQVWQYDAVIAVSGEAPGGGQGEFELRGVLERRVERQDGEDAWIVNEVLLAEEIEASGAFEVIRDYMKSSLTRPVRTRVNSLGKTQVLGRDASGVRMISAWLPEDPIAPGDEWETLTYAGPETLRERVRYVGEETRFGQRLMKLTTGDGSISWISPEDGALRQSETSTTETVEGVSLRLEQKLTLLNVRIAPQVEPEI